LRATTAVETIRRRERMDELFRRFRPDVVLHAAAYKHVGMLEDNPLAAAANNILGTWNVAHAALDHGVREFVLISTDKAVNPTSVMGASKRACEILLSSLPGPEQGGITRFNAVRFGNVLGSNGSVVQIFQKQIAEGGPVTVTHREVRRYFMTIGEAAQLVLQAASMGRGSEIFVLDMGELIKIMDLAHHMVRLAGLVPGADIEIRETGLKPGEKLYEEVMRDEERTLPTSHSKALLFKAPVMPREQATGWLERMRQVIEAGDSARVVTLLSELIPEYEMSELWKARLKDQAEPVRR
jgi:FlaA1/EpsC-like NDP-sugar epimerase